MINYIEFIVIKVDLIYYKGDLILNLVVLLVIVLVKYGVVYVDFLFVIGVVVYLFYNSWDIVCESVDYFMDKEFLDEEKEMIFVIVNSYWDVYGVYDICIC